MKVYRLKHPVLRNPGEIQWGEVSTDFVHNTNILVYF